MEQTIKEALNHEWYMRPVFFVSDVQRAIGFYVGKLGFKKKWHEADGKGTVCQPRDSSTRAESAERLTSSHEHAL
jgi:catechol 2,3-dioxygenase-like lactoylglutathione lyase family enzyme